MSAEQEAKNRTLLLKGFETLFNKRDYAAAEALWSPDYVQHSAFLPPGRDGLFGYVRSLPPEMKYELHVASAYGDFAMAHGRFSNTGLPASLMSANIVRIEDGRFVEHWEVLQDEATRATSKSGRPMFGDHFPDE